MRPPRPVRDRDTFRALRSSSRRGGSGPLTVRFVPDPANQQLLVGYSIGRRYGGAVERNRCRRRLRVLAAEASPGLAPGAYLIEARPGASSFEFSVLKERVFDAMHAACAPARAR